ncbi:MAG: FAD-dependent oxidoreductase [Candidatus Kerfeldbacteria bacterium]|nr:FAD-dependent oxidoreductase [Candidatus Kerfeldbacteria bacterium]
MEIKNTSPWLDSVPDKKQWSALSGEVGSDVVVVGGGIAGVMTAYRLAVAGQNVVLLEKNHIATGDTGFTTAFVTRVPDVILTDLAKRHGLDFVKNVFQATTQAQTWLRELIQKENIDCDFQAADSFDVSYESDNVVLAAEWKVMKDVEPKSAWVTGEAATSAGSMIKEAIRVQGEGAFDVRKFIFTLLHRPTAQGVKVYEESPMVGFEVVGDEVLVTTDGGSVRAKRLVIATGQPLPIFPEFAPHLKQKTTYAVTAEYSGPLVLSKNIFWDTDRPYQYFRKLDDPRSSRGTIMLGGADQEGSKVTAEESWNKLKAFLRHRLPGDFTVTRQWSGSLWETVDGLPYVAAHPWHGNKVVVITGLNGNGMVMGAMAAGIATDLVLGRENASAKLFDFSRNNIQLKKKTSKTAGSKIRPLGWVLAAAWALIFLTPGYVFFHQRGGLAFLQGTDLLSFSHRIFPLFGLYAFTLVWTQFMIGTSQSLLKKVIPRIITFHRREGAFALTFALLHPLLLFIGVGHAAFWGRTFVAPKLVPYVWLGYFQLLIMCTTAGTALLMRLSSLKRVWHTIHYLNYVLFVSIWIHSWFLGSDVQSTWLKYLWLFAATAITGVVIRLRTYYRQRIVPESSGEINDGWETIIAMEKVAPGQPHCTTVTGQALVLIRRGDGVTAMDNTCSHAGGRLCDGTIDGQMIVCPLHSSAFDVRTGAVVHGPARLPQRIYPTRIVSGQIQVRMK